MKQLPNKQQGFTLLELLVVITLLAVLSVGALVAYEGVGENAQATAQANNTVSTDKAIRNYRAVTGGYPNQWDNLSKITGGEIGELAAASTGFFGEMGLSALQTADAVTYAAVKDALDGVGIEDIQQYDTAAAGVAPNLQHNEGANTNAAEASLDADEVDFVAMVPSFVGTGCTVGTATGPALTAKYDGTDAADNLALNKINDALEDDECHLVVALGFGHDAAHSTFNSSVAVGSAPTFTSKDINPSSNYARYIALFHLGTDEDGDNIIQAGEINTNARMIAVVAPDGKAIDEALAAATATN